jgi:glycosyltransferase involved in cell wall biosynthesis
MTKRVVLLDTGKEWGGGTNSLLELLKRIDRSKYEFTCVFYDDYQRGGGPKISEELARLGIGFVRLPRQPPAKGAKLLKETVRVLCFFSKRLRRIGIFLVDCYCRIRPAADRIAEVLRRQHADLLYMNNQPSSNLEGILAARAVGIPVIQHSRIDATLNPIEARIANKWLRKIICVSEGVKQRLVEQGIDTAKCTVVHNGIDANTKPRLSPAEIRMRPQLGDELLIGTVGSLIRRKRVADLIRAVAILVTERQKAVRCLIVGAGPEQASLATEAKRLGIADNVVFTGFQDDAVAYIDASDIFALPSEKEGLPRVVLEAMLMAKPVVASRVIGPSELVVDGVTGYLLPLGEIHQWVDALDRLIEDAALRKRLGQAGRQRVLEHFSIDKYVTGVSRILDEVLESCST